MTVRSGNPRKQGTSHLLSSSTTYLAPSYIATMHSLSCATTLSQPRLSPPPLFTSRPSNPAPNPLHNHKKSLPTSLASTQPYQLENAMRCTACAWTCVGFLFSLVAERGEVSGGGILGWGLIGRGSKSLHVPGIWAGGLGGNVGGWWY